MGQARWETILGSRGSGEKESERESPRETRGHRPGPLGESQSRGQNEIIGLGGLTPWVSGPESCLARSRSCRSEPTAFPLVYFRKRIFVAAPASIQF